ncbi:MAG: hypothetical protein GEU93_07745 [Propionibacteriales bacterium]|nr:hypothetical protein [Propionibacteriales bacterium]
MTHPDIETIADQLEGLLERSESERIAWHLAGCATCSATASDLAEVRSVLRAEGRKTVQMPPDMVDRLEAVIERESAERTVVEGSPHGAPVRSLDERRRARRRRYAAGGLIAAAALTAVGVGLGQLQSGGGSGGDAATAEAQAGSAQEDSAGRAAGKKTPPQELSRRSDAETEATDEQGFLALGPRRRETLSSVVESVRSRRSDGDDRRRRPACVEAVFGEDWAGASYRIRLNGRPGAVVLYPTSDPTDAWVIRCGNRPRELLHRNLTD